MSLLRAAAFVLTACAVARAADHGVQVAEVLDRYSSALDQQDQKRTWTAMETRMKATVSGTQQAATMSASRFTTQSGEIYYTPHLIQGDTRIQNEIISRFVLAEKVARADHQSIAVTPANYKFKYKGIVELESRRAYIFEVTPRRKEQGLFKGDVWIDAVSYLVVQESGYFVVSPSIFLRNVSFIRRFEVRDGVSVPTDAYNRVDTRSFGQAELTIQYDSPKIGDEARMALLNETEKNDGVLPKQ